MAMKSLLIRGTFVHTPTLGALDILNDHLLGTSLEGTVIHFAPFNPTDLARLQTDAGHLMTIPDGAFIIPTFCDLHLHAPQFLYQGTGLDLPLMEWLSRYAFQAEERIDADPNLARRVYDRLARCLIENGTGTVLLFGTIREDTNIILAQAMQAAGLRAFVGKLSMDISRPTYTEETPAKALAAARSFVNKCRELEGPGLVAPVLTPRFIPTCSDELLHGLGNIIREEKLTEDGSERNTNEHNIEMHTLRIQSHMAEAQDEVEWVRKERGAADIDIFDRAGLLTTHTIQAHCTFLDDPPASSSQSDFARLKERGTAIAHCPLSNAYFSARPFALREALDAGVHVGLGTDVAGGYSADMMTSMRWAVGIAKTRQGLRALQAGGDKSSAVSLAIDWKEALFLATRGGSKALRLSNGSFEIGAAFDAQLIRLFDPGTRKGIGALNLFDIEDLARTNYVSVASSHPLDGIQPDRSGTNSPSSKHASSYWSITEEMVEKWWCLGDGRNRAEMWVQGHALV